jgi:predicted 3-demethylubiquinone-9 3-methyltransferase (glyoxalase superfamily)
MQKITPFLWFDNQAEEAARFYTSIFKNSKIGDIAHYTEGTPGPNGSVMTVRFTIEGQEFIALNGGPEFKFNESISFVVNCGDQAEIDYYWSKFTVNGGQEVQCGWLKDKYGVSWQIVPAILPELIGGPDEKRAARVMQALMKMIKLDIAKLKTAHDGK